MEASYAVHSEEKKPSVRFSAIKKELLSTPMYLCPERALLITEHFKKFDDPTEPMAIRKARAFRHLLSSKTARIFPGELIVGNVGSRRKSVLIQPELAGTYMSEELLWIDRRKTTPHLISWKDRLKLLFGVIPYWLPRNMIFRAFRNERLEYLRYAWEQLNAAYYLVNEAGGIGHFLPDYEKMISIGVKGFLEEMDGREDELHRAARIACEGLVVFAGNLATEAHRQAVEEKDALRAAELHEISRICRKVPREPAETFHEALQSLWLTHLAVCLEGLNSAVSFGRVDQYLYPYYRRDCDRGHLTPQTARELLLCFSAKSTEHVFLMSERTSEYHGGYLVVQAATVGGVDREGNDAENELTWLFLDVMEESGLRDPNYLARVHGSSSDEYLLRLADVARQGKGVPAMFNDDVAVEALTRHGLPLDEARNYGIVGCVEPSVPGRSFFSTDAALFNIPICLILALNGGRHWGSRRQIGARTLDPSSFSDMRAVVDAFRCQMEFMVGRFVADMHRVEKGNRDYHPTPFSSMLVTGCLETGTDLTAGGARFNWSGVQGVGVADTADSLAALDDVVFKKERYTLEQVVAAVKDDFNGHEALRAMMIAAPKFGNDIALADDYACEIVTIFHEALSRHAGTRGGPYVPGFYSSTCHVGFGKHTGALPSGRKKGEPLAASLGASNGRDRLGATALLNSAARIDGTLSPNGYALNLRFDPHILAGERGARTLSALVKGFFASGGMEMQLNVLDPDMLEDAFHNPGKYPGIVVRVAGYCAYFDDLPASVQREIINRTRLTV
ncbi:MAG: formate acetyltransferase [Deltaproteobacteria bacterium]|nr:formate acetyltransferase [Deltaproteobacteria bacterium]